MRFGGLYYNRQIKIRQNFLLACNIIRMAIPYRTAKFKSTNILAIAILGSTAKFNARQYFRLYGSIIIFLEPEFTSRVYYIPLVVLLLQKPKFVITRPQAACSFYHQEVISCYCNCASVCHCSRALSTDWLCLQHTKMLRFSC